MSAPTTIRRAGYGTTTQARRPPDPYIVQQPGGRADMHCRSCPTVVACLPSEAAARLWARYHRCVYGGIGGEAT